MSERSEPQAKILDEKIPSKTVLKKFFKKSHENINLIPYFTDTIMPGKIATAFRYKPENYNCVRANLYHEFKDYTFCMDIEKCIINMFKNFKVILYGNEKIRKASLFYKKNRKDTEKFLLKTIFPETEVFSFYDYPVCQTQTKITFVVEIDLENCESLKGRAIFVETFFLDTTLVYKMGEIFTETMEKYS